MENINEKKFEKAYSYAIYLLSLKLRTEGEVREKLLGKKYEAVIADQVIARLKDNNYLDDQRYAEVFLENLKSYKGLGFYGIQKKLMQKKLPKSLVDNVLSRGLSVNEELKIAQRFLKKEGIGAKAPLFASEELSYNTFDQEKNKDKQKVFQKLKARGFRGEVIGRLVM